MYARVVNTTQQQVYDNYSTVTLKSHPLQSLFVYSSKTNAGKIRNDRKETK